MFCTKCGSELPKRALFCIRCGNRVAGTQAPTATEQPVQVGTVTGTVYSPTEPVAAYPSEYTEPQTPSGYYGAPGAQDFSGYGYVPPTPQGAPSTMHKSSMSKGLFITLMSLAALAALAVGTLIGLIVANAL